MYADKEKMSKSLLIAARFCGEIDDDGGYLDDDSEGGMGLDAENTTMQNVTTGETRNELGYIYNIKALHEYPSGMKDAWLNEKGEIIPAFST